MITDNPSKGTARYEDLCEEYGELISKVDELNEEETLADKFTEIVKKELEACENFQDFSCHFNFDELHDFLTETIQDWALSAKININSDITEVAYG